MSRWTNPFTRRRMVILALMVLTAAAIYTWQVTRTREPAVLTYCLKYAPLKPTEDPRLVQSISSCVQTKTLKVPAAYYGVWDSGPGTLAPEYANLEVAYPSMKPWSEVPWLEKSKTHKIELRFGGVTAQTVDEIFANSFLGTPKPIHVPEPLYGLNRFDMEDGWGMYLLPLEQNPRTHIRCGSPGLTDDPNRGWCTGTTYTGWQFKLTYVSPKFLLPQWQELHAKVISLVDSFVVNP